MAEQLKPLHIGLVDGELGVQPVKVTLIAREYLDEMLARHARLVHAEFHDPALVTAHFIHHETHLVA